MYLTLTSLTILLSRSVLFFFFYTTVRVNHVSRKTFNSFFSPRHLPIEDRLPVFCIHKRRNVIKLEWKSALSEDGFFLNLASQHHEQVFPKHNIMLSRLFKIFNRY